MWDFRPPLTHPRIKTWDGGFAHCHPFGSCFDTKSRFSTSPNPPLHWNARQGVCSLTITPLACVSTPGILPQIETWDRGFMHPAPPLWLTFPHQEVSSELPKPSLPSKHKAGELLTHHRHPFGSHFNAMGLFLTSQNLPLHRNVRWEVCSPKVCVLIKSVL